VGLIPLPREDRREKRGILYKHLADFFWLTIARRKIDLAAKILTDGGVSQALKGAIS
jgi:hypothetical protein